MKKATLVGLSALGLLTLATYPIIQDQLKQERLAQLILQERLADQAILEAERPQAEQRFYFNQLSSPEQEDYLRLVHALRQFDEQISLKSLDASQLSRVYLAVTHDFPEFYWLSEESGSIVFSDYRYPPDARHTYQQLQEIGDQIVSQLPDGTDHDKVKYIYEYLIRETDYHTEALTDLDLGWQDQSIRSVFLDKQSVCAGYSRAFQFLCQKAGIPCIYVAGDIVAYDLPHAWNLVQLDGQYYPVDTTWGDPVFESEVGQQERTSIDYSYFLMPKPLFEATHTAWERFHQEDHQLLTYPDLGYEALGYYQQRGSYFRRFHLEELMSHLDQGFHHGQQTVDFQFEQREDYERLVAELASENSFIHQHFQGEATYGGYRYTYNPHSQLITISFI